MVKEYIEREAAKTAVKAQLGTMDLFESRFNAALDRIPAADVVAARYGRWVWNSIDNPLHRICNQCGAVFRIVEGDFPYNVCPNCGAKMRGEKP